MSEAWTALEHQIWKQLKEHDLTAHDHFILAISGGLDSMVLLEAFLRIKPAANIKVAYYHHGPSDDPEQQDFRKRAGEIVQHKISGLKDGNGQIVFCTAGSPALLQSEDEMRNARWAYLRSLQEDDEIIVTGHHLDDRLETMLLKMIRGTGPEGFAAFKVRSSDVFRPFLETPKDELLKYAQKRELVWIDDPSNKQESYLRNWLREKWLKELDNRVESGSKNLAKSLLKIEAAANEKLSFQLVLDPNEENFVLNRQWYVSLSKTDQLRGLALFLKMHQIHSFTSGQLEEIRKRLDKNQKDFTFELLKKKWVINVSQIVLL